MNQLTIASLLIGAAAMGLVQTTHAQSVPASEVAPKPIVLKANHLFDSVSGKMLEHGVIVVVGKKIQAVGADVKVPEGAQVIDLGDATLLPGFIDAHVHLSSESSANWYGDWYDGIMRFPAEQALYGAHYAKVTLEAGVTTVRDLGRSMCTWSQLCSPGPGWASTWIPIRR
jgi:imidazolonepropionase-like amidohydrolase